MADYYREHHLAYHLRTFHLDPSSFLGPLTDALPCGSSVLDVGCGSGRDLLWLKCRGYEVMGLERVAQLAAKARQIAGCPVIQADFESFDFGTLQVDAVLLVGALVHLSPMKLAAVLRKILQALRPQGWVLLTLKEGSGQITRDDGRVFYLWEPEDLEDLTDQLGLVTTVHFSQPSITGAPDTWLTFLLKRSPAA